MKAYFIIGTDTDCGKTYATCKILEYLKKSNKKVKALKPVASGCYEEDGFLISSDANALNAFNNGSAISEICPWRFRDPVSPHLAARHEKIELSTEDIAAFCLNKNLDEYDVVLIEGAGGLMVPLNDKETWIDVLQKIQIPVVLVVGMQLGCINHALLTMEVLQIYDIQICGWVANCLDKDMLYLSENIATLVTKINAPLLGIIPFSGDFQDLASNYFLGK